MFLFSRNLSFDNFFIQINRRKVRCPVSIPPPLRVSVRTVSPFFISWHLFVFHSPPLAVPGSVFETFGMDQLLSRWVRWYRGWRLDCMISLSERSKLFVIAVALNHLLFYWDLLSFTPIFPIRVDESCIFLWVLS